MRTSGSPRTGFDIRMTDAKGRSAFTITAYKMRRHFSLLRGAALALLLCCFPCLAAGITDQKTAPSESSETPKDTLGRMTPRGALLGFLNASRKGNAEVAALYLNTPLRGEDAATLARQLSIVLDRRLPPRLTQISDAPEGSIPDPLRPDEDLIGTIDTAGGQLDITVERVDRGKAGKVWLFSRKTLSSIPAVFQELNTPGVEQILPEFLVKTRILAIPLFEWLAVLLGLPLLYLLTGLLNRGASVGTERLLHRFNRSHSGRKLQVLPAPVRLLVLALIIHLLTTSVALPLLARQFWSTAVLLICAVAAIWLLFIISSRSERYVVTHRYALSGSAAVVRLFRRLIDATFLFAGLLFILHHFGINPTAALAGIGVGGIAVALAAQKTLENVIGGVSLIADKALRVGDFMNLGDVQGTVEEVGLRSTRIRTLDRTVVNLPNGQLANMRLETFSVRDKYWFHPVLTLRLDTTLVQLRSVVAGLTTLLKGHRFVDPPSVRVRFFRLGTFSFDIDIFAYVFAPDWSAFLEIQEELLFEIMESLQRVGTAIAFPSQSLYVSRGFNKPNPMAYPVRDTDIPPDRQKVVTGRF